MWGPMPGPGLGINNAQAPPVSGPPFMPAGLEWYGLKLSIMLCLIGIDMALNSSLEYDLYRSNNDVALIMFGVHIFAEICIILTLFLMLCDTYLFKVGLLGVLFAHFRAAFCLQPLYLLYTLFLDGTRVHFQLQGGKLWDLYHMTAFQAMAVLHKLVAALYYMVNIRAVMKLTDPIFYRKEPWMELYRESVLAAMPPMDAAGNVATSRAGKRTPTALGTGGMASGSPPASRRVSSTQKTHMARGSTTGYRALV